MLFNSYTFIFGFLPVTLFGYVLLGRFRPRAGQVWLTLASFFFYGYWDPIYLPLLVLSCIGNFLISRRLADDRDLLPGVRRALLWFGITGNLAILGYFKYSAFVMQNVGALTGINFGVSAVILPLGVSFFTFHHIMYLVDLHAGRAPRVNFTHYTLYIAFFPQLLAGPLVRWSEILHQFDDARPDAKGFAMGITHFSVGLFKKVVFADNIAGSADAAFATAAAGEVLSAVSAWHGILAYTLQLYFDFSGYSDMAIGLALMFGIRLPFNFNSPYKASSIIEFWRRWHMTLSRFLRDYLYVPLGGNRNGKARRYLNLMITMVLGGLWHGAGWTFLIWGFLHGAFLMANHAWTSLRAWLGLSRPIGGVGLWSGRIVTLACVMVAWVFFRAPSVDAALQMLTAMAGWNGLVAEGDALARLAGPLPSGGFVDQMRYAAAALGPYMLALVLLGVVWLLPNTQEIVDGIGARTPRFAFQWQPTAAWAGCTSVVLLFAMSQMSKVSAFLYFQF